MPDVRRHPSSERGSALIMALVFTTVVSLVVVALLGLVRVNLRTTRIVQTHTDQLYAADAGLQHAVEALRLDRTLCPIVGSPEDLPDVVIDGTTVDLTCQTTSGSSSGAEGWAVIAHSTSSSGIATGGASSQPKTIEGPVFAARLDNFASGGLSVSGGSVFEQQGTGCSSASSRPSGLVVAPDPPFTYRCTAAPIPTVVSTLPSARPAVVSDLDGTDVALPDGSCRVFLPGTYTAEPVLDDDNYFVSGVYYFENIGVWDVQQQDVTGGQRDPLETGVNNSTTACDDYVEDTAYAGTGVKWILGGSSAIDVRNQAEIELFSRSGGPASEGQQAISLQAVESSANGFVASTLGSDDLVDVSNGSTAKFSAHGLVHAPRSSINFVATNDSRAQLRGGLVIGTIEMSASASASGLVVSVRSSPEVRQMVVTARVPGAAGSVAVEAVAVLRLDNNEGRTFSIESWRTGRDTTP